MPRNLHLALVPRFRPPILPQGLELFAEVSASRCSKTVKRFYDRWVSPFRHLREHDVDYGKNDQRQHK
jgi:hypothetical protein